MKKKNPKHPKTKKNKTKQETQKNPVPFVINKRSLTKQYPLVHQKTPGDLTHAYILEMEQIKSVLGFFLSDHSPSSLPRQFKFPLFWLERVNHQPPSKYFMYSTMIIKSHLEFFPLGWLWLYFDLNCSSVALGFFPLTASQTWTCTRIPWAPW